MTRTFKHAIIACHPDEDSFTLSMARRYAETVESHGHAAVLRDLYRLKFDPVLGSAERTGTPARAIAQEWATLGKVDVYVLVYPIWFGTPPAMLKGYVDRVFGAGRDRGRGDEGASGELLAGKRLVSLTASGSLSAWLSEKGVLGSLRTIYDRYFADVFGFDETHRFHFDGIVADLPEREIAMHLHEVDKAAREVMARMTQSPPDRHPNTPR
jgi:NAD(P)H dehydrogenase (quinone)